jgi:transcriptional regulator with XRE-family HTH domain
MASHDSSARSREIGEELRKKRLNLGLTGAELAHRLGWSGSKVSRMESGQIGVSEVDAAIFLTYCGVLKEEAEELLKLTRQGNTTTWLQEGGSRLPDQLRTLVYHETTAAAIASFEPMLVPGLLQTEDYARAVFDFANIVSKDRISDALQARLDRQAVLHKPDPPECVFYLREAGLRSKVGSNRIMHEQLLQLVFLTSRPQYQIRLLSAHAGPHEVWGGMFMLMGFATHGPVVYVETLTKSVFLEKPADVASYQQVLKRLDQAALDAGQSRQRLAHLASEFDKPEDGPDADE